MSSLPEREAALRRGHRRLGRLLLAVASEPAMTRAWAVGSDSARRVGPMLDECANGGVIVLHDRRMPETRANIHHLVIAPAGVYVVDAKRYRGAVEKRDVGPWGKADERLFVGRRDRTRLVHAMVPQVAAVQSALKGEGVPVIPVLAFVDGDWGLFDRPFMLDGVLVIWAKGLPRRLRRSGPLGPARVRELAQRLDAALPPA
jgi:hypothetical protein